MKVCFVGNLSHTFAQRDYDILSEHFDVDALKRQYIRKRAISLTSSKTSVTLRGLIASPFKIAANHQKFLVSKKNRY